MAKTATIAIKDQDTLAALQNFLKSILNREDIGAILAPQALPMKRMVMPALVTDPALLDSIDPLAPVFPMNSAKVVSKLSRKPMGSTVAVVLRPCEIRAFIELLKLKQGRLDEVVMVGIDCLGAYKNTDYFQFVGDETRRASALEAIGRIAQAKPDLLRKHTFHFFPFLADADPRVRGYTAWFFGNMGAYEARDDIEKLLDESHEMTFYEGGIIQKKTVGQVASEALEKFSP